MQASSEQSQSALSKDCKQCPMRPHIVTIAVQSPISTHETGPRQSPGMMVAFAAWPGQKLSRWHQATKPHYESA